MDLSYRSYSGRAGAGGSRKRGLHRLAYAAPTTWSLPDLRFTQIAIFEIRHIVCVFGADAALHAGKELLVGECLEVLGIFANVRDERTQIVAMRLGCLPAH